MIMASYILLPSLLAKAAIPPAITNKPESIRTDMCFMTSFMFDFLMLDVILYKA